MWQTSGRLFYDYIGWNWGVFFFLSFSGPVVMWLALLLLDLLLLPALCDLQVLSRYELLFSFVFCRYLMHFGCTVSHLLLLAVLTEILVW